MQDRLSGTAVVSIGIPQPSAERELLSEQLDDGASQCRMKSRLCLGVFLKNELNELTKVFDRTLEVSGDLNEETMRFMVISLSLCWWSNMIIKTGVPAVLRQERRRIA